MRNPPVYTAITLCKPKYAPSNKTELTRPHVQHSDEKIFNFFTNHSTLQLLNLPQDLSERINSTCHLK